MAKKKKINVVYSTNQNFNYDFEDNSENETLAVNQQNLKVFVDRKNRKGKSVTIVSGFIGTDEDLKTLGKQIKSKCGVGGSVKDNEVIIQGELKDKIYKLLIDIGYQVKMSGG